MIRRVTRTHAPSGGMARAWVAHVRPGGTDQGHRSRTDSVMFAHPNPTRVDDDPWPIEGMIRGGPDLGWGVRRWAACRIR
jgi:hypothetical protein